MPSHGIHRLTTRGVFYLRALAETAVIFCRCRPKSSTAGLKRQGEPVGRRSLPRGVRACSTRTAGSRVRRRSPHIGRNGNPDKQLAGDEEHKKEYASYGSGSWCPQPLMNERVFLAHF